MGTKDLSDRTSIADEEDIHPYDDKPELAEDKEDLPNTNEDAQRPPDGGWGWMVVFGCFLMQLMLGSMHRSFGIVYVRVRERFDTSAALIAWVGGGGTAVRMGLAPVATAFAERYGTRKVVFVGSILMGTGLCLSSIAPNAEYLLFTYSFLTGIGGALVYSPGLVIVGKYFDKKRGKATGISTSGSGVGAFLFPPVLEKLFQVYGFFGALLIEGAIMLNVCISAALFRPLEDNKKYKMKMKRKEMSNIEGLQNFEKSKPLLNIEDASNGKETEVDTTKDEKVKKKKPFIDFSLLKQPVFFSFAFSMGIETVSYISAQMMLPDVAHSKGISEENAAFLLSVVGITDTLSRLGSGVLFDLKLIRPIRRHVFNVAIVGSALTCYLWGISKSYVMFVIVTACHGIVIGIVTGQRAVICADLVGVENLSSAFGLTVFMQGVGLMVGPLFAGWLRDVTNSYFATYMFYGVIGTIASITFYLGHVYKTYQLRKNSATAYPAADEKVTL